MFAFLKALFETVTWSERVRWVSPPLQGTKFRRGKHLKQIWLHDDLSRPPADKIYLGLGEIDISHIEDRIDRSRILVTFRPREVNAETCREFLKACLGLPAYDDLVDSDYAGRLFRLDLAITGMSPGLAALRLFEGLTLLGLGHAHLQIEGVLWEPRSGETLLKLAARRRHSGITAMEDNLPALETLGWPGDFHGSMVGQLIRRIAYDVLMELDAQLNKDS